MTVFGLFGLILAGSHIPGIQFLCHCTYRTLIWCSLTIENVVRIVRTVSEKIEKKLKNDSFLAFVGLILAKFFTSQPYDFDAIHI